uniref:Erythromycin esterase n=1 Tax=Thermosporothrix sp. COM3 TaxID=2490863 RepID=A0A455SJQ9_9CHLR|nr:erythromycin esterase [Thermosporothrix sp. COM3]
MSSTDYTYATLDDWMTHDAITFSVDQPGTVHAAIDAMMASLGDSVEVLGFGEALHSGESILTFRNQLFERLVGVYGFSAIALESSLPLSRLLNDYIAGRGPATYDEVKEIGFGQGFGNLEANRELVEWMKRYNADPTHPDKLHIYGFDMPTSGYGPASPEQSLNVALDYLTSVAHESGTKLTERIRTLVGKAADWENPAALTDPAKAIGLSPAASKLRIETEDLITELRMRGPELAAKSGEEAYKEALHYASLAQHLLTFHAALARQAGLAEMLGIRDLSMADNLAYIAARERGRGKVLVFAHNRHLQRGVAEWELGADIYRWWPAGSHLSRMLGTQYAIIGTGVGVSKENGIASPEEGSLEARLTALDGAAALLPTYNRKRLPTTEIAALSTRTGSTKNTTYFPLSAESFTDFDYLAFFHETDYARGGWPLPDTQAH